MPSATAAPSATPRPATNSAASGAKPTPQKQDEWTAARNIFEQLSGDQQKKFLDNLDQWRMMSPQEQELYRDKELFRRKQIAQEIQAAIQKSNLKLDEDQREVYALRYTQERRKIEESLRKEMDQKRQIMVDAMLSHLKVEFNAPSDQDSAQAAK